MRTGAGVVATLLVFLGVTGASLGLGQDGGATDKNAIAHASARCMIGGAPSFGIVGPVSGPSARITSRTVIGCGGSPRGAVELVIYRMGGSICFSVDRPTQGVSQGGDCQPVGTFGTSACPRLCLTGVVGTDPSANRFKGLVVFGEAGLSVRSVTAEIADKDQAPTKAVVGRVDGKLMQRLGQSEPFVLFGTVLSGCALPSGVLTVARDGQDRLVAKHRGGYVVPQDCRAP